MKEKDALKNKDDKCYQTLRSMANFLLRAPEKNIVKVSALEKTDRYKNDKNLQLIVECVKDLYFVTTGDSKSAIVCRSSFLLQLAWCCLLTFGLS